MASITPFRQLLQDFRGVRFQVVDGRDFGRAHGTDANDDMASKNIDLKRINGPHFRVETEGSIFNPWFEVDALIVHSPTERTNNARVTPQCRWEFPTIGLMTLFSPNSIFFEFASENAPAVKLANPFLYFVTYLTYVEYRITWPSLEPLDLEKYPLANEVSFAMNEVPPASE